jgi:hypothetical protein
VQIRIKPEGGTKKEPSVFRYSPGAGNEDNRDEADNLCSNRGQLGLAIGIDDTGYTPLFTHKIYVMPTSSPHRDEHD